MRMLYVIWGNFSLINSMKCKRILKGMTFNKTQCTCVYAEFFYAGILNLLISIRTTFQQ